MTERAVAVRHGSGRARAAPSARFIGREYELADLRRVLAEPPAVVLIEGEAGIGKSRLLHAYLTSPAGQAQRTLVCCCPPFGQPQTLGPLTDALRGAAKDVASLPLTGLAGALRPFFPEWTACLPPALEPAEDATLTRHRVFRALAELIECLQMAIVVVEDAHWADEVTLEFLLYLASHESAQVSLAVTYRPEDLPARSLLPRLSRLAAGTRGLRLSLAPLDVADTGTLMSSMLAGEQVSAEFATFVHDRTEGVPLAVEELVKLMADRADLAWRDGRWVRRRLARIVVPPTVRDAVLERAGRLSEQARTVLRSAAVLAAQADEVLLTEVADLPAGQAQAGLTEALCSGLLREDARGLVSFRHALAGQAVHDAIPGPDRRELHLRAGHALERRSLPATARLARHFRQAGDTDRWSRYAEQAVDVALASGDESTAAGLLSELIDEASPLGGSDVMRLLGKISPASIADPDCYRRVERSVRSLLDGWMGEPSEKAEVRLRLAAMLSDLDEHQASRRELERALPHLTGNPSRAARALTLLGAPHDMTTPASVHLRYLRRAERLTESLQWPGWLPFLMEKATALLMLGEEEGWAVEAQIAANAVSPADTKQVACGQLNSGDTAMTWGRYADSRRRLAKALELAEAYHYRHYREVILATQVHLDWFTGAWDGLFERAQALAEKEDSPVESRSEAALVTGLIHAARGAHGQAEERLQEVMAQRRRDGAPYYIMEPAAALARLLLADGRVEDALRVTEEAVRVLAAKNIWIWATDVVPARVAGLAAAGRTDEATGLVSAFARGLRNRDAPAPRAGVILCRAILARARGEHTRAANLFGRAALALRSLPRPYDAWLAQDHQAKCVLAAGHRDSGLALLDEVFDGLTQLGATGDAARVGRAIRTRAAGPQRAKPTGRRGYGNQLSPRELDVAGLLVAGGTNKEIGDRLFLSPKTVARHLESAMRKLGVGSRTALAVRLVEEGVVPAGPQASRAISGSRVGSVHSS
jgi:DNA-binding CsgD family transcriptional regulator/tetratricopeptide (TPR) repeat protein